MYMMIRGDRGEIGDHVLFGEGWLCVRWLGIWLRGKRSSPGGWLRERGEGDGDLCGR